LFAAFDIANGEVVTRHDKRRRRVEFLDFMNRIVAAHRGGGAAAGAFCASAPSVTGLTGGAV
jgi:hypothetical protein